MYNLTSSVLVLGANSDIAEAICRKFASENFNLVLAGRNTERLNRVSNDISLKYNVHSEVHFFDALKYDTHYDFYTGFKVIPDITVCVFGYLGDQQQAQSNWNESLKILETNFIGAVSILNIIANDYETRKMGCIVGISSVAGERGRQSNYFYGSAKGGFSIYLDGLRNRLAKNKVHVMSVKPGFVDTKMTENLNLPKPITASPEQVASAVFKGFRKKRNTIYVLPVWGLIMTVIKIIPEAIFKKLNL